MILEKPLSWLIEKIGQDYWNVQVLPLLNLRKDLFEMGGFVAGGFLRRAMHHQIERDYYKTLTVKYSLANYYRGSMQHAVNELPKPDIDFWFPTKEAFEAVVKIAEQENKTDYSEILKKSTDYAITLEKVFCGNTFKLQLVRHIFGSPEEVLENFDFVNCQIATDLKSVWVSEDFLECEFGDLRRLKINPELKTSPKFIHERTAKYIVQSIPGYSSLQDHSSGFFTNTSFEKLKTNQYSYPLCVAQFDPVLTDFDIFNIYGFSKFDFISKVLTARAQKQGYEIWDGFLRLK